MTMWHKLSNQLCISQSAIGNSNCVHFINIMLEENHYYINKQYSNNNNSPLSRSYPTLKIWTKEMFIFFIRDEIDI